jgi:hypothetical protein
MRSKLFVAVAVHHGVVSDQLTCSLSPGINTLSDIENKSPTLISDRKEYNIIILEA